jgi:imidazolonepropionase-like amidohydrolase
MSDHPTAIVGGTALIGRQLEPVEGAVILIQEDRIAAAGPASDVTIPRVATTVDASNHTLFPGFIDAHVHIGFYDPALVVHAGVTTVRDLGWPPEQIWPLVRASASPRFKGPTIVAAGPMLTVEGGYPTRAGWAPRGTGWVIGSVEEARRAVEELGDAGASVIKVALDRAVGPTLDSRTLGAIVDAAHHRGLKVTGHTYGLDELHKALDAGVDELAHMLMSPDAIPEGTVAAMVAGSMVVVPTLSIFSGRCRQIAIDNLVRLRGAGGRVIYGTDLGNQGPSPGIDKREVEALAKAGMSAHEIIASATVCSAEWLGLTRAGALEAGLDADIVAVGGDLDAHGALARVDMVWRRGRRAR